MSEAIQTVLRATAAHAEEMRRSLRSFARSAWKVVEPATPFIEGVHLDAICDHLTYVSLGDIDDLVINIPPRHTKSTMAAVIWPAWEWTWQPSSQWLFASYAHVLSLRDSVKCRRLIQSPWYQARYGRVFSLSGDLNQKQRFDNNCNGYRLATSVGGTATGEGGDRIVVDDPHNMNEIESDVIREGVIEWWRSTMSTRGNNPKKLGRVIIGQRGHYNDLCGFVLNQGTWVHLNLPGYFKAKTRCVTKAKKDGRPREGQPPALTKKFGVPLKKGQLIWADPRTKEDELLTPGRFGTQEMEKLAAEMTTRGFAAQIQQTPSEDQGNVLKKHHWRLWEEEELPPFQMVVQSYDTAFEEEEENDYSARTTWGVFELTEEQVGRFGGRGGVQGQTRLCAMILERFKDRLSFPDLRDEAMRADKEWKPDRILIEKKASGHSLAQELQRAGLPVARIKVTDSKFVRAHAASLVLERGCVWHPDRKWAWEVIDECAQFPAGEHDDITDTVTMMLLWLRRRWNVEYLDEEDDNINLSQPPGRRKIYG